MQINLKINDMLLIGTIENVINIDNNEQDYSACLTYKVLSVGLFSKPNEIR